VTDPTPPTDEWGSCRFCGVAVPPRAAKCEICGAEHPLSAAELPNAPRSVRRRIRFISALRVIVVVVIVAGLSYTLIGTWFAGPPNVADPLTTSGMYAIGPGNTTVISGEITGGDFVIGNWTAVTPPGANVSIVVYNQTQWSNYLGGALPGTPQWTNAGGGSGRIIYSAPVTDNYYFVVSNPYPEASHLTIDVYVVTEYQSNVADEGFG
jgi:hypothetical protein